jgi:hypothetical protein
LLATFGLFLISLDEPSLLQLPFSIILLFKEGLAEFDHFENGESTTNRWDEIGQHRTEECHGGEGHAQHIRGALANQDTNGDHQAAPGGSEEKTRCMP